MVESIGENVEEVKEGEIVVPVFLANCEECLDCKSKKSNICTKFPFSVIPGMPRDGTSRFMDSKGEVLHNFFGVSSFAEYTVVDITHLIKITHDIPVDKACLLSCGVSTGTYFTLFNVESP
ncbi:Alcohol dehydrogenase superfamily [Macleaya cordata]|uniref:Alcohol dehydrogenase superfamily n=1 Tax=Macleaya cordata TaxID=56857 RepID=A0A200QYZ4_MACCD|nr:Alcohol dehydrogenase superfamily [Macleaya cordata]